jgi:hypothetical protein
LLPESNLPFNPAHVFAPPYEGKKNLWSCEAQPTTARTG